MVLVTIASKVALAQGAALPAQATDDSVIFKSAMGITAGFAIAIAAFGGAISQSRVAAAAMEGISRNPESLGKIMTPMIIALALIESLVIYTLVISFLLHGKI